MHSQWIVHINPTNEVGALLLLESINSGHDFAFVETSGIQYLRFHQFLDALSLSIFLHRNAANYN